MLRGLELHLLMEQSVNYRITYIREELNDMYSGDFTIPTAAKAAGISDQGLRDIEILRKNSRSKKNPDDLQKPRSDTLERLAGVYRVPFQLFEDKPDAENHPGFFLGKEEDEQTFFDDYYITYHRQHELDSRKPEELRRGFGAEYLFVGPYGLDLHGYDVIEEGDDGRFSLDRLTVEITMKAYQASTGELAWIRRIGGPTVILPEDETAMDATIQTELAHLSSKFEGRAGGSSEQEKLWLEKLRQQINQMKGEQIQAINKLYETMRNQD
jgi:hypothetical protein